MTVKRKFDLSIEDDVHACNKQIKLFQPIDTMDTDVAMSDAPSDSSDASPTSAYSPLPSPQYPTFQLYPNTNCAEIGYNIHQSSPTPERSIGLMQPAGFAHNNGVCNSIPKLRVSCESGPGGRRTMWSFCEDCGAIALME